MEPQKKAIVLLSGGLDSTTALAIARQQGYRLFSMAFDYGQRHRLELRAAKKIARVFQVEKHLKIKIDLRAIGGSALTSEIAVPKNRMIEKSIDDIPVTYVPARNAIFLSVAVAWGEAISASDIFIGVNSLDYSGYPDCRSEFIEAFQTMANMATKAGTQQKQNFMIHTPLIALKKAEIIKKGLELGVDYSLTSSCYDPSVHGEACGRCDACQLRLAGFEKIGVRDPIPYIDRDC